MSQGASKAKQRRNPGRERPQREWWHRYLEPEERRRVMTDLAITRADAWLFRFTVMLTLSVVVAVMGLSADSAAVVIGAMLLAPLMTPVLGLAASLAMTLLNKIIVSAVRVALATVWSIGIAYLISLIIPDGTLPNEVISRTSPDLRDLVVALAAGLAGSYATIRTDVSSALPGVAVAVALVPPLGTVGITLEAGRPDLAAGALLLYGTNLAAIILAGVLVFLVTGFVPPRRLARTTPGVVAGGVIATAVVVAVAVPLIRASVAVAESAQLQQEVDEIVSTWLQGYELDVDDVDLDDETERVSVAISGLAFPPDKAELEQLLVPVLGENVKASVQWTRTEQATTSTTVAPTTSVETDEERRLRAVQTIVEAWLDQSLSEDNEYELESISLRDDDLRVDVIGTGQSPSVDDLLERLDAGLDDQLTVRLTWIPRSVVAPVTAPDPVDVQRDDMRRLVDHFAADNDVSVLRFEYEGEDVVIELAGAEPPEITDLTLDLQQVAGDAVSVTVYFVEWVPLQTTTTTSTSTAGDDDGTSGTTG